MLDQEEKRQSARPYAWPLNGASRPPPKSPDARSPEPRNQGQPPNQGLRLVPPAGEGEAASTALREAFTPTRPKQKSRFFAGRLRQMRRIINAIEEERAHVVLYGERGSGKTSLANVVATKAEDAGYFVVRRACSSELSFDDIFRGFLRGIPTAFLENGIGAQTRMEYQSFADILPAGELRVADLVTAFSRLRDKHVILVVDEYDRVTGIDTKNKLAELMKNVSDASLPVTLLLIGVAEDVDELLGRHPSLRRTLVTIPLPLMNRAELAEILAVGERRSGMIFLPEVREGIIDLSAGLPYHVQLLGLFAARSAQARRSRGVEPQDLTYAVERAIEETDARIPEAYAQAIAAPPEGENRIRYRDILDAAACCASDQFGSFSARNVAEAAGKGPDSAPSFEYRLQKLTERANGAVLVRSFGPESPRFRFVNQMMRHFVLLKRSVEGG